MDPTLPRIDCDPLLPISAWADEIVSAIKNNPVVVVAGETGSGKTTQLPKMCLMAGRKAIGHTQPRRIAARSVATRLAAEMGTELGDVVGYQVRFHKSVGRKTQVKIMTDGILLAQIANDRDLRAYDTIIIDEAHERSLNIDFLLGYLKQLLRRRPELRVIVTSATIDTSRFSEHFNDAPIIEVSGRTYPVDVWYRPLEADEDADQVDGIRRAVEELWRNGPGDILVFCSGEREIRDAHEGLEALKLRDTEILPLFARLSLAEQNRVFSAHSGYRIVLATNVAETSLTVPGIRYVIDPGTARISRYSPRSKVQRLPIEPISQASANQRAGRCGRVGPGICVRLYSDEDFAARPAFTDPEIIRTNLAAVILQMAQADLGDISTFPFVEPPVATQISDGIRLLRELDALSEKNRRTRRGSPVLTKVGRTLAALPVDPRLGRMLIAAADQGCVREMQIVVSGLAIPDIRERPSAVAEQADAAHRRFWAPMNDGDEPTPDGSDIMSLLRLWGYVRQQWRDLSSSAFRRMCRAEYLSYLRIREWQDLHTQLKQACKDAGIVRNENSADPAAIHRAVLAGLLSHIGLLDDRDEPAESQRKRRRGPREYLGARGSRFAINPGSSAAKTSPSLVMAVELVETSRLWARTVAPIEPEWVESVGSHVAKRRYGEPHWSKRMGNVMATETVTVFGVPIITNRPVVFGRIDPQMARQLFIQSALVEGEWSTRNQFFHNNQARRGEAALLEERTRRRDVVIPDEDIFAFYDERIPAGIFSTALFDTWWGRQRRIDDTVLDLSIEDLTASPVETEDYPDVWSTGGADLPLHYVFDPGDGADGVSVDVDVARLHQLDPAVFSWHVPGMREELAVELLRSLPKNVRTRLVPVPDTARVAVSWLDEHPGSATESFPDALARALRHIRSVDVPDSVWAPEAIPKHLQVKYRVLDQGKEVATGTDLSALRNDLAVEASKVLTSRMDQIAVTGRRVWDFEPLPYQVSVGDDLVGYPAVVDEGNCVGVVVFDSVARQTSAHQAGICRLACITLPDTTKGVVGQLSNPVKLGLADSPYPSVPSLLADCRRKAVCDLLSEQTDLSQIRDGDTFTKVCSAISRSVPSRMIDIVTSTAQILDVVRQVRNELAMGGDPNTISDASEQLANLIYPGFVAATPSPYDRHLSRYLEGLRRRLVQARANPTREQQRLDEMLDVEDAYAKLCADQPPGPLPAQVENIGWLMEELRVSLFAQSLGTTQSVSAKRVMRMIAAVTSG